MKWLPSDEFWRGLERLSYFILFPAVMFNYISKVDTRSGDISMLVFVLVLATIVIAICLIIYQKKRMIDGKMFTSLFQGGVRYNSYIFFALANAIYGKVGVEIVVVVAAYMIIFTNVICVLVFTIYAPKQDNNVSEWKIMLRNFAINPLIISSLVGLLFNYYDIRLGSGLDKFLTNLSDAAFSMGLLCVGSGLKVLISLEHFNVIRAASIAKLVAFPAVSFVFFKFFGVTGICEKIGILYSALPTASNSYLLSRQLGGDHESMSSIIASTTILSIISLSIFIYLFT
jgi:predicted permease